MEIVKAIYSSSLICLEMKSWILMNLFIQLGHITGRLEVRVPYFQSYHLATKFKLENIQRGL